ncbi:MAG: metallophosphoesterase [Methanosarcinales archaeon]|nr:metallophosphoesterase [Methanosarcinales archaeon]
MADVHDHISALSTIRDLDADLIAFCGDLHNDSQAEQARPVAEALAALGPVVLIVPGNMDPRHLAPGIWERAGLKNIHQTSYRQGGWGFIGLGGMVLRNPRRLGDPTRYYHLEEEVYNSLVRSCREIADCPGKVVVTHQPPWGACDLLYNGQRSGSTSLRRFIEEHQPDLVLCGHIHEDRGEALVGTTRVVNVGEMRKGYAALVELGDEIKVSWVEPGGHCLEIL